MDFKQRIVFRDDEHKKLVEFLDEQKIKYEHDTSTSLIVLKILESNKFWPEINKYLVSNKMVPYTEGIYSKEEMKQAEWFTIRSKWRWEYPQPADDGSYQHITYSEKNYCDECGSGLVQIDGFRVKKTPKWSKKNFLMLNWIDDELFLSDNAKIILSNSNLRGFEFIDVVKFKTDSKLDDINQLKVNEVLSPGLVNQDNTIREIIKCKKCGVVKYAITGRGLVYKKSVFRGDVDIVNSFEVFGWGHAAPRGILVNQKFYQVITSNYLDKNLEFEPIKLI
jgi:hypothetical protein